MKYKKKSIADILRSSKTVFTFKDVSLIWGDTNKSTAIASIGYYVRTGQLYRIRRGIYAKDKNYNKQELATRIFTPAYISFETILGKNGINFQYYSQIFVASYLTREIIIDNQTYSFKKIKNVLLTNPLGINYEEGFPIASKERALLDTAYINRNYHFDNIDSLDWEKLFEILLIYNNKRMTKEVNNLHKYYKSNKPE